jgi:hypothetical protein
VLEASIVPGVASVPPPPPRGRAAPSQSKSEPISEVHRSGFWEWIKAAF